MKVFEILYCCAERRSTAQYGRDLSRDVTLLTCRQKIIVKVNIMGEILSHDVTLLTCQQKIIVKVNIIGEILSRDVTLLTCRPKIIVKVNISEYYGRDLAVEI